MTASRRIWLYCQGLVELPITTNSSGLPEKRELYDQIFHSLTLEPHYLPETLSCKRPGEKSFPVPHVCHSDCCDASKRGSSKAHSHIMEHRWEENSYQTTGRLCAAPFKDPDTLSQTDSTTLQNCHFYSKPLYLFLWGNKTCLVCTVLGTCWKIIPVVK